MKTSLRMLCILLCALCLLVGCTGAGGSSFVPGVSESVSESDPTESSGQPDGPDVPDEEPDFFTQHGQSVLPEASAVPACCETVETDLYRYNFTMEREIGEYFDGGERFEQCGNLLLYIRQVGYHQVGTLYDLETGKSVGERELPDGCWTTQLQPDGTVLCVSVPEYGSVEVSRVGTDGWITPLLTVPCESNSFCLSADGTRFLISEKNDSLDLYDLTDGSRICRQLLPGAGYFSLMCTENGFLTSDKQSRFREMDAQTGELRECSLPGFPMAQYGGLYHCYRSKGMLLQTGVENDVQCYLPLQEYSENVLDCAFGCVVTQWFTGDGVALRIYDLRAKQCVREVLLDADYLNAFFLQNGRILVLSYERNTIVPQLFDLPHFLKQSPVGEAVSVHIGTVGQAEEDNRALADAIYESTGVEVLYGSEGNDFQLYEYVGVAELDPYVISDVLEQTREILERFPKNMLRETYAETNKGLKFYLCGRLYGLANGGGLTEAGAVTTELDGYIVIAFNCGDPLSYNIPHELSHAFDRRINWYDMENGVDFMQRWESATAIDNPYIYSYSGYDAYTRYTYYGESDPERVWFVDSYGRTFPTEDRARFFENLCNAGDTLPDVLTPPHMQEKAKLYCEILRTCFPSCAEETPFWEVALQAS